MGFVFAVTPSTSTLKLTTSVPANNHMGFYAAGKLATTADGTVTKISSSLSSASVALKKTSQNVASFGWVSNSTTASQVTVSSTKFYLTSSDDSTTKIGYTLVFDDNDSATTDDPSYTAGSSTKVTLIDESTKGADGSVLSTDVAGGYRFKNYKVNVTLQSDSKTDSYLLAASGDYKSIVTITNTAF